MAAPPVRPFPANLLLTRIITPPDGAQGSPVNRPTPAVSPAPAVPIPQTSNPRVHVTHSPGGTVTIVGVTITGDWVAEYRCYASEFDLRCVAAMERRVLHKERQLGIPALRLET